VTRLRAALSPTPPSDDRLREAARDVLFYLQQFDPERHDKCPDDCAVVALRAALADPATEEVA
jgi:hypothetical protein